MIPRHQNWRRMGECWSGWGVECYGEIQATVSSFRALYARKRGERVSGMQKAMILGRPFRCYQEWRYYHDFCIVSNREPGIDTVKWRPLVQSLWLISLNDWKADLSIVSLCFQHVWPFKEVAMVCNLMIIRWIRHSIYSSNTSSKSSPETHHLSRRNYSRRRLVEGIILLQKKISTTSVSESIPRRLSECHSKTATKMQINSQIIYAYNPQYP